MPERGTQWRQGSTLKDEEALRLGMVVAGTDELAILISHDCDIPNQLEPDLEFIVGTLVDAGKPEYFSAQNPRTLHLRLMAESGQPRYLELNHSRKNLIAKGKFDSESTEPNSNFCLDQDDKRILKQWLAARYGRPSFPDIFQKRLISKVRDKIKKAAKPHAEHLIGLFFDLDEDRHNELEEGEPYFLKISVVYRAEGGPEARESAEAVASRLQEIFEAHFEPPERATDIALDACTAVADTHFTLADIRRVDQWSLEYISLREGENGDFIQAGATPP